MTAYATARSAGVAAFMQATGRDRYLRLLAEDRAAFFGAGGRPLPELLARGACGACGGSDGRKLFEKDGFPYLRCEGCRTLYVGTPLTEEVMSRYYASSRAVAAWNEVLLTPAQLDYDRDKYARLLGAALPALGGSRRPRAKAPRVLDVGASVGTFLDVARGVGCEIGGVEISDDARRRARDNLGIDIAHKTLADARAALGQGAADLVTFFEVIEHLPRPIEALADVHALLAPGGRLLVLIGGNADSISMRVLRERSLAFDFTRLHYYSPDSFAALLHRAGFEVEARGSIIPEVDVAVSMLSWDDPYRPAHDDGVLPAWFRADLERLVADHLMGYKFWVVARRRTSPAASRRGGRGKPAPLRVVR